MRMRRQKSPQRRSGSTTPAYTSDWFPGASPEARARWRHAPDLHERWASMDYDERWTLTVILDPWRLGPGIGVRQPLPWELLLEKWRWYRRQAG